MGGLFEVVFRYFDHEIDRLAGLRKAFFRFFGANALRIQSGLRSAIRLGNEPVAHTRYDQREEHHDDERNDVGRMPASPLAQPFDMGRRLGANRFVAQEMMQIVGQRLGRIVSLGGILVEQLEQNGFQFRRNGTIEGSRPDRIVIEHLLEQGVPVRTRENRFQCDDLEKRRAERIEVSAMIEEHLLAGNLFGTGVADGAHQIAGSREVLFRMQMRQPEIGDPQIAMRIDQQVGGLDVAMDDALIVGVFQSLRGLRHQPHDFAKGFRFLAPRCVERSAEKWVNIDSSRDWASVESWRFVRDS